MQKHLRDLIAFTAALLASKMAFAGNLDSTTTPAPIAPQSPVVFDWSGFYAGVHAGYIDAGIDITTQTTPSFPVGSPDADGGEFGIYGGYNWQLDGPWVLGVEGEYNVSNASGSDNQPLAGGPQINTTSDINNTAALRAKVGYAIDRTLIYVAGGWAYIDYDLAVTTVGGGGLSGTDSGSENGWTLGAGIEHAFSDTWRGRLDYRYSDFSGSGSLAGTSTDIDLDTHQIRFGIAAHF